jgi:hypothetical protein
MISLSFWIARLIGTSVTNHPALESVARSALGRRASTTIGLVTAATYGIRSIRAGFVPRASTSGLRRSALSAAAGLPIPIGTRIEKRASILSNRILLHVTTRFCSLLGVSGAFAVPACAKVTILRAASRLEWQLTRRSFEVLKQRKQQQEKPMSKHDSVTKRKRRPKSDKRVDYTARTMAMVKQLSEAAKVK